MGESELFAADQEILRIRAPHGTGSGEALSLGSKWPTGHPANQSDSARSPTAFILIRTALEGR